MTLPTSHADFGLAAQRSLLSSNRRRDFSQIAFGRFEQLLAFMRSQPGEVGVAADDQPFARKIARGDRRHVAIVEQ